jgi:hypothetical protein
MESILGDHPVRHAEQVLTTVPDRPFEAQGMPWSGGIIEETSLPPRVQSTIPITDAMA